MRRNNSSVTLSDCSEKNNSLDSSDSETKETTKNNTGSSIPSNQNLNKNQNENHEEEMKKLILGMRQKLNKKESRPAAFYSDVYDNLMVKMNKSMNMLKLAAIDHK